MTWIASLKEVVSPHLHGDGGSPLWCLPAAFSAAASAPAALFFLSSNWGSRLCSPLVPSTSLSAESAGRSAAVPCQARPENQRGHTMKRQVTESRKLKTYRARLNATQKNTGDFITESKCKNSGFFSLQKNLNLCWPAAVSVWHTFCCVLLIGHQLQRIPAGFELFQLRKKMIWKMKTGQ